MRYREGATPNELGPPVSDDMLVVEAAIALLVGVGLTVAGVRGRQIWLAFWGGTLVLASTVYLGAIASGFR